MPQLETTNMLMFLTWAWLILVIMTFKIVTMKTPWTPDTSKMTNQKSTHPWPWH